MRLASIDGPRRPQIRTGVLVKKIIGHARVHGVVLVSGIIQGWPGVCFRTWDSQGRSRYNVVVVVVIIIVVVVIVVVVIITS